MKTFFITTIAFLTFALTCKAQWTAGTGIITTTNSVGIGTTSPASLLTVGVGNNSSNSKAAINTANANVNALLLSNWIGSATTYGPKISFDNSTFGAWALGASDGANNFDIARTWGTPDFRINSAGNVGIGTSSPSTALQIGNFLGGAPSNQLLIPGAYNFEQVRLGQISNGNSALEFVNHNNVSNSYGIKFLVDIDQGGSGLQIQYAPPVSSYAALSYTTGMYMNLLGNVGIGTLTPDQKLSVNGTIHSKSVVVDANIFPDYVFKPTFKLPTLAAVKTYIDKNHHLPDVPSATEVEKNGLNLGEMNKVLVQKVEELTLYLIEQNKQLADQQKVNKSLQNQINHLTRKKKR